MLDLRFQVANFMPLGIYISVPFCRSKCSYCNFASGVFAASHMERYAERLCADMASCREIASEFGAEVPGPVDSIYFGGGTPSLLSPEQLTKLFTRIANEFAIAPQAEVTVECAPSTLTQPILEALVSCGVNRVSLGVQSFVDREAAAVARLHTREKVLEDIAQLRKHGISNINVDLIAGLPHQTGESWKYSLEQAVATGVPHVSVYMLEVDEDSRLGRELMAGGARYHAHFVPDEDLTADFYEEACAYLEVSGVQQYEISNFARAGLESGHNLKYWMRQPYFGFGVDAHSMLPAVEEGVESVRLATTDSLEQFIFASHLQSSLIGAQGALEESFFLGLRLNRGVDLNDLRGKFGEALELYLPLINELAAEGLLSKNENWIRLTPRGRLLSNEVFEKFISHEFRNATAINL
jgi:oxygen-independent coproporphyrinogen-3 oxidase